jgi:hypothetical protein
VLVRRRSAAAALERVATFVCQWPAAGIELTRKEIDAQLLSDAAKRAQVIFADDDPPDA